MSYSKIRRTYIGRNLVIISQSVVLKNNLLRFYIIGKLSYRVQDNSKPSSIVLRVGTRLYKLVELPSLHRVQIFLYSIQMENTFVL